MSSSLCTHIHSCLAHGRRPLTVVSMMAVLAGATVGSRAHGGPAQGPRIAEPAADRPVAVAVDDYTLRPITEVTNRVRPSRGEMPKDYAAEIFGDVPADDDPRRSTDSLVFSWEAAGLCHRPLYFEEVNAERYGYRMGIAQPAVSLAHFFGRLPMLPYMMTVNRPHECIYTLGQARPGSCVAKRHPWLPLRADASFVEGAVATGLVFLIP